MTFARSIGDPNPIYFDEEYASSSELGHLIAPPTFLQSSAQFDEDYPLRPKIGAPWFGTSNDAGDGSSKELGLGLHAEQHYEYGRVIRPGEVLHVRESSNGSWQRDGRRGGRLRFSETIAQYFDESGELVVTARSVVVYTSRSIEPKE